MTWAVLPSPTLPVKGVDNCERPLDTAPENMGPTRGERGKACEIDLEPFTPSSRPFLAAYRGVRAGRRSTNSVGAGEGSDYVVSEFSDGFRIEHPQRVSVTVRLDGRAFMIAGGDGPDTRYGLCQDLTARVGRHLLQGRFLPQNECYFERRA